MTEKEVMLIINKILSQLSKKFAFGYLAADDMSQEGFIFAIEGLEKYDGKRPLENFLRVHIRNRFLNLKRNKYRRCDPPPEGSEEFRQWEKRNNSKQSLMKPSYIGENVDIKAIEVTFGFEDSELVDYLLSNLDIKLRGDFLRLLDKCVISSTRKQKVKEAVEELLCRRNEN